jgi:hypothetical protein
LLQNAFVNTSGQFQYISASSTPASGYRQLAGAHDWYTAAAGTSPNQITDFATAKMTLDSTGLGVGVTPASGDGSGVFKAAGTGALTASTRVGLDVRELTSGNQAGIILGAMTTENTGVIGARTASGNIAFQTYNGAAWGERARIDYLGNLSLTNGNVILSTSGRGIDFSATSSNGTSELLADYEEGTWTPVFQGTVTSGTYVYSTQVGRYTKVGNLVTVFGHLVISSITTAATGVMRIGGLPFTTSSVNVYAAGTAGWTDNITISSGTLALSVNLGGVVIDLYRIISGAGVGFITPSDLVVNTRINFTATYFV